MLPRKGYWLGRARLSTLIMHGTRRVDLYLLLGTSTGIKRLQGIGRKSK